jgi:predicted transcriptional regulator of viral defense system
MAMTKTDQVLQIARRRGVVRARDLKDRDLPPRYLSRLADRGELEREGRGLYRHPDSPVTEHHSLALVAARYSGVVVCLLSALQFHELTTQMPRQVWVARAKGNWTPKASPTDLEVIHMSEESFTEGIHIHDVEGVSVQVFSPAKTVADCFKFRSKVGLSVAIEALRDYVRSSAGPIEDLYHFAEICRVETVMRPYIEATV